MRLVYLSDRIDGYRQIEILKFETCLHGNGGQTFKP